MITAVCFVKNPRVVLMSHNPESLSDAWTDPTQWVLPESPEVTIPTVPRLQLDCFFCETNDSAEWGWIGLKITVAGTRQPHVLVLACNKCKTKFMNRS